MSGCLGLLGGPSGAGVAAVLCPRVWPSGRFTSNTRPGSIGRLYQCASKPPRAEKWEFCVMSLTLCRAMRDIKGRVLGRGIWSATTSAARGWDCRWQQLQDKCRRNKRYSVALQLWTAMPRCCNAT